MKAFKGLAFGLLFSLPFWHTGALKGSGAVSRPQTSCARRLSQNDEDDHHGAQTAASVKIWLMLMVFPLAIIAAIISNVIDIIRSRRYKLK